MNIVVSVHSVFRDTEKTKNWKAPFKKLKLSSVRAEDEWRILLGVAEKEIKKLHKLCDDRFKVETVVEEEFVSWEDKTAQLGLVKS